MQLPPRHPVTQSVLQRRMVLYLVAGVGFSVLHNTEAHWFLFDLLAVAFVACYVVLFGLHWVSWLLREHELWREGRTQPGTADPRVAATQ